MTANNLATRLHNYFSTSEMGPVPMSVIIAQFRDDPALVGMDTASASRKLRRVLSVLDDIVKLGDKRGAAYVYDPVRSSRNIQANEIALRILQHHVFNGGRYSTERLYDNLIDDITKKEEVNRELNNLLQAGALIFDPPETVLNSGYWTYSGNHRATTSFSHTGTTQRSMEPLEKLLSEYSNRGESLPGTSIPAPTNPSRSMAIEAAIVFTVAILKNPPNSFLPP